MTPLELQEALNVFLKEHVANEIKVKFIDSNGHEKEINPSVFSGWLVPKLQTKENKDELNNKEYAHISTRIIKIDDSQEDITVSIKIIFGIQSYDGLKENCIGYIEICNLIERTRQILLKQRIIDKKFKINAEIESKIYDEQFYPYWAGEMTTVWQLPVIRQEGINFDN